jgi:NADPH2:quinone reductase
VKAAFIRQTGPADCIEYGDLPQPQPVGRQVLVKTAAVAVNPVDTYIRNGANYWELPQPFIIGCDVAGTVEAIGPEARGFEIGQRVWATNQGLLGRQGTFAEYCAIEDQWLYPTPEGVSDEDAAACALVGITAHLGLFREAGLQSGERVFVQGGTGGVGSMVLQMAKAAGAWVVATAGSPEKAAAAEQLGADAVIQYRTEDVVDAVNRHAAGGVQVFWETRREPDFDQMVACLAERGRGVLMAGRDARPAFPVGPFYVKGCSLHGFVMFKATADELRACAADINRWLSAGQLKAHISRRLPLAEAARAHQLQEDNTLHLAGTIAGKIVLSP